MEKFKAPKNQKSIYAASCILLEKIMNGEIKSADAEQANAALANANRTIALELKRSEITTEKIRNIESANFDDQLN